MNRSLVILLFVFFPYTIWSQSLPIDFNEILNRLFEGATFVDEGKYSADQRHEIFKREFQGKQVVASGRIEDVGQSILGNKYITIEVQPNQFADCYPSDDFDILKYSKGQVVTFVGEFSNLGSGVVVHHELSKCTHPDNQKTSTAPQAQGLQNAPSQPSPEVAQNGTNILDCGKIIDFLYEGAGVVDTGKYTQDQIDQIFEKEFKGKQVLISGTIFDVGKSIIGNKYVTLEVRPNQLVNCYPAADFDILSFTKGKNVTFLGKFNAIGTGVMVNHECTDCVLQANTPPSPAGSSMTQPNNAPGKEMSSADGIDEETEAPTDIRKLAADAESGDPYALSDLGIRYSDGRDVPQDKVLALVCFYLSARYSVDAQNGIERLEKELPSSQVQMAEKLAKKWSPGMKLESVKMNEPGGQSAPSATIISTSLISEDSLKGKSKFELDIMRNEPYARHGYIFKRKDLQDYFQTQEWYKPQASDMKMIESTLTDAEKRNIQSILNLQKAGETLIEANASTGEDGSEAVITAKSGANLRSEPTSKAAKISKLKAGETVTIIAKSNYQETMDGKNWNWYKVKSKSQTGWILGGCITILANDDGDDGDF